MTRDTVENRMGQLKEEMTKASEELGKLRPRVQFLEAITQRLDGALTVLQELLDVPEPDPRPEMTAQRLARTDDQFAPSWQAPVAP